MSMERRAKIYSRSRELRIEATSVLDWLPVSSAETTQLNHGDKSSDTSSDEDSGRHLQKTGWVQGE